MSFQPYGLLKCSRQALERLGIETPTPIQAATLPPLLEGRDVIGQARTGSGKTLAFALPMMEFLEPKELVVQALVLCPTRELAAQVASVVDELGKADGIRTIQVFGGRAIGPQEEQLRRGCHIVVGAPGRVLDLAKRGSLKLDRVQYLVLDEADEMLDRGFAPDVERILKLVPKQRQTALFSATMPEWVNKASKNHMHDPEIVRVAAAPQEAAQISQMAYWVPPEQRMTALTSLLDRDREGSAIVFGRTKRGVRKLARQLEAQGYAVGCLQGNMSQNARDRVMADFRSGTTPILVATNVAARGLDVNHVELVVNYELPETAELLTHRIGRTGRMDREGTAITLLTRDQTDQWRELQRGLGRTIESSVWGGRTGGTTARRQRG